MFFIVTLHATPESIDRPGRAARAAHTTATLLTPRPDIMLPSYRTPKDGAGREPTRTIPNSVMRKAYKPI